MPPPTLREFREFPVFFLDLQKNGLHIPGFAHASRKRRAHIIAPPRHRFCCGWEARKESSMAKTVREIMTTEVTTLGRTDSLKWWGLSVNMTYTGRRWLW